MLEFQSSSNGSSVYASAPSRPPAVLDSRTEPAVECMEILWRPTILTLLLTQRLC